MRYFTADWHLGDDRLELMGRNPPFYSAREAAEKLIQYTLNVVRERTDTLYFNGDICYKPDYIEYLQYLPVCKRILLRGNHDRQFSDKELSKYFDEIIPEEKGIELVINNVDYYITHYPTQGHPFRFNLVGHIHGIWKCQLNMLNVGIDVHQFRPIDENKVEFYYKAIHEFYDRDAWAAYEPLNTIFYEKRGRKDRYLDKKSTS